MTQGATPQAGSPSQHQLVRLPSRLGSQGGNLTSLVPGRATRLPRHLRNCSEELRVIGEPDGPYASLPPASRTAPPARQLPIIAASGWPVTRHEVSRWEIWPRRHWLAAPCGTLALCPPQERYIAAVAIFRGCSGLNPFRD